MKPKYYPHATAFGATVLVSAPLCFVLALPTLRDYSLQTNSVPLDVASDTTSFPATKVVELNNTIETLPSVPGPAEVTHRPVEQAEPPVTTDTSPSLAGIRESLFRTDTPRETRVAMRSPDDASGATGISLAPESPNPVEIASDDAAAVRTMTMIPEATIPVPASVPVPESTDQNPRGEEETNTTIADHDVTLPATAAPSFFDATGHLSMAGVGSGRPNGAAASSGGDPNKKRESMGGMGASPAGSGWPLSDSEAETAAPPKIVDVILQQPLESRRVNKVENVIAVCREAGWPIALVKSDLPDDYWWVQQMVGIRGNAFAARVNFGNAESISGSVYHMVFVFLDSPDEVRRFRIAKQFKELPEGIRRSREFTFVRR